MSAKQVEPEVGAIEETTSKPVSRLTRWYRSPLFNVIVVGLISFTQPGIWNALNSMLLSKPRQITLTVQQIPAPEVSNSRTLSMEPTL